MLKKEVKYFKTQCMVKTEKFGMTFTLYTHEQVNAFKLYMLFNGVVVLFTFDVTGIQDAQLPLPFL